MSSAAPRTYSAPAVGGAFAMRRVRAVLRFARRCVLPVLALAAMVPGVRIARDLGLFAAGLVYAAPAEFVLLLARFALIVALPVLLFAASGVSPRRWWRVAVAVVIAGYGAAVVRPVSFHLLAASDYLATGGAPEGFRERMEMGRRMMRANPEAAARRAVRAGDERAFVVAGFSLRPMGVIWTIEGWDRLGAKTIPGAFDGEGRISGMAEYQHEVTCWVARYDRELARILDTPDLTADTEFHACDPPGAAR
jgi:hypothetical protein